MIVDWRFDIAQQTDQVTDSGYALYAALAHAAPALKERDDWQLVSGPYVGLRGGLWLASVLEQLQGQLLRVGGGGVLLGDLGARRLIPKETLTADRVILCDRAYPSHDAWLIAWGMSLQRRLDHIGAECTAVVEKGDWLSVHRHRLRTFKVTLNSLSDEASLAVQREGIGSKRKLGCGVFR